MVYYQPKKNNPYRLPHNLYMRVQYTVKDFSRSQKSEVSVMKTAEHMAIKKALEKIPEEYRKGVFKNIVHDEAFPLDADPETYRRWKRRFLYFIAEELRLL